MIQQHDKEMFLDLLKVFIMTGIFGFAIWFSDVDRDIKFASVIILGTVFILDYSQKRVLRKEIKQLQEQLNSLQQKIF